VKEDRKTGLIDKRMYFKFWNLSFGYITFPIIVVLVAAAQSIRIVHEEEALTWFVIYSAFICHLLVCHLLGFYLSSFGLSSGLFVIRFLCYHLVWHLVHLSSFCLASGLFVIRFLCYHLVLHQVYLSSLGLSSGLFVTTWFVILFMCHHFVHCHLVVIILS
jgi:hypothetical protein